MRSCIAPSGDVEASERGLLDRHPRADERRRALLLNERRPTDAHARLQRTPVENSGRQEPVATEVHVCLDGLTGACRTGVDEAHLGPPADHGDLEADELD